MAISRSKVAMFLDYESLYYGLKNQYGLTPNLDELWEISRKYGKVEHAQAFGDFSKDLSQERVRLAAASIDVVHAAKRADGKSYTDFMMLDAIYRTLIQSGDIGTFLVVTGDGHFAPCLGYIRHRLGKVVIVLGVSGTISLDLYQAATTVIELPLEQPEKPRTPESEDQNNRKMIRFIDRSEQRYQHLSFSKTVDAYVAQGLGDRNTAVRVLNGLIEEGCVLPYMVTLNDGSERRLIRLNRDHPYVRETLGQ